MGYAQSEPKGGFSAVGAQFRCCQRRRDFSGAGWYAVPEPTSGLLMLVGLAGLALCRKRAQAQACGRAGTLAVASSIVLADAPQTNTAE